MAPEDFEITETDEAGHVIATYVSSPTDTKGISRLDIIRPETKRPWQRLLDVFLPAGYPHSVTDDYLEYQIYDSLQAFASSIAGLLSSRAVLSSVGVGDSTASPTAALLLSILQESAGRIATILFADRYGTALEPECKRYRLLADILNDFAFVLDCLSPGLPKTIRVVVLSFSSVLRALCGVAAGSAKASLSAHFAQWGNLGELNAKDSSQETVISLIGMLAGSVVVSWVTTPMATWTVLILLLAIHLETNRRAVRAVSMRTLNRQRASLVYYQLKRGHVPTPKEVSGDERIFERDDILRNAAGTKIGYCTVGVPISTPLKYLALPQESSRLSPRMSNDILRTAMSGGGKGHLLMLQQGAETLQLFIVIKKDAVAADIVTAWWHALAFAEETWRTAGAVLVTSYSNEEVRERLQHTATVAAQMMDQYQETLIQAGWDLDVGALETKSSTRVAISDARRYLNA